MLKLLGRAALAVTLTSLAVPAAADAQYRGDYDGYYAAAERHRGGYDGYRGDYRDRGYGDRRGYYGQDYRRGGYGRSGYRRDARKGRGYYRGGGRCRDNGTGGTIIGAIAGGLLGNAAVGRHGDNTAGTIVGAGVGAVAGRAIDRNC